MLGFISQHGAVQVLQVLNNNGFVHVVFLMHAPIEVYCFNEDRRNFRRYFECVRATLRKKICSCAQMLAQFGPILRYIIMAAAENAALRRR